MGSKACCCPASQAFKLIGKSLQFSGPAVWRWQAFPRSVKEQNHKVIYLQGSTCFMWQDCCDICVSSRISVLHTIDVLHPRGSSDFSCKKIPFMHSGFLPEAHTTSLSSVQSGVWVLNVSRENHSPKGQEVISITSGLG